MWVGNKSMDQQNKRQELVVAWRAFDKFSASEGWQTIDVSSGGPCKFKAARKFPNNEETLLIGFNPSALENDVRFPKGKGFIVTKTDLDAHDELIWVALSRQAGGNLDLFILMTLDIISTLELSYRGSHKKLFNLFLSRIKTWQDFMQRDDKSVLNLEAQVGLLGELEFLRSLIRLGVNKLEALESWVGPMKALRDFEFKNWSAEVKTTTSTSTFIANIGSLDQLDPLIKEPLYLAGIKLEESAVGESLPDVIMNTRQIFELDVRALTVFNLKIKLAGYYDELANQYSKRYLMREAAIFHVSEIGGFPYLSEANVPAAVISAKYEIDLSCVLENALSINEVLKNMGVTN